MKRNNLLRSCIVLFFIVWAVVQFTPLRDKNIIDVFAERAEMSDTNLTAIIKRARTLDQEAPGKHYANLVTAIGTNELHPYFMSVNVAEAAEPNKAILSKLQRDAAGKVKLGIDLQGGVSFLVQVDTNKVTHSSDRSTVLDQAIEVLRKRVDRFGVAEPIIQAVGEDRIQIQMPGLSEADHDAVRKTLQQAAFLEFRMVNPDSDNLVKQGLVLPGYELLRTKSHKKTAGEAYEQVLVKIEPEMGLTGSYIESAGVEPDPLTGQPQIHFKFNTKGAEIFAEVTRKHIHERMAIVLDGQLYSAPVIQGEIPSGSGQITGDFDRKEATELANVLENPLEAPVHIIQENTVDPTLGSDAIHSGIVASLVGTGLVAGFMAVYYLLCGLVANIALVVNIVVLLGVMCSFGTTLTLPGIAGIVLTIGMAVDANVLIYERIREELAKAKSLRGALEAGYDRAFGTIFDSHVTTLISAIVLWKLGTGSVQGFGVTLTVGVAASLFTALVVTRRVSDLPTTSFWYWIWASFSPSFVTAPRIFSTPCFSLKVKMVVSPPATTLGRAPSIPATAMITFAAWMSPRRRSSRCRPATPTS